MQDASIHISHPATTKGHIVFVGAGPGDPDLLTRKALKALTTADVVIHDRLVSAEVLAEVSTTATLIDMGKTGFGPSTPQAEIDAALVAHAKAGAFVVRLKAGDPTVFGRLDEEIEACLAADIPFDIVPGITSASAAVASLGQSMTRRGRNAAVRLVTGHNVKGYADHDWRTLARPGEVAAIYMGKRAARFLQGRLMMHGAAADTPVTLVENASRPTERIIESTLGTLPHDLDAAAMDGPCLILLGLAPRKAAAALDTPTQEMAL
ncbi:MAG: uroporphyrinogen-III C-methyltransferase [Paracoccaceae bacterium]